jgi:HEPN domain-containing protein
MSNKYTDRFIELESQISKIESTKYRSERHPNIEYVESNILDKWKTNAQHLIQVTCGNDSVHYNEFINVGKSRNLDTNYKLFKRLVPVFLAAKDDYLGGYFESVKSLIQADVFSNELEQAEELLDKGYYEASAVIAGTVLETYLRELCSKNNIAIGKLNKMNDDLAKNGVYNNIIQKQIVALSAIRNSAAHGKKEEFTKEQVKNMIVDIKNLLTGCFV